MSSHPSSLLFIPSVSPQLQTWRPLEPVEPLEPGVRRGARAKGGDLQEHRAPFVSCGPQAQQMLWVG